MEKVEDKRRVKRWSRKKLAEEVGCSAQMIYLIERKDVNPSLNLATKIADKLGCAVDDLLNKED